MQSEAIESLIKSIQQLPGIGNKSAKRLVLYMLKHKNTVISSLINSLNNVQKKIINCHICNNTSEQNPCQICIDINRDKGKICVVKDISDIWTLEGSMVYNGLYHVLGGNLSAIEKIGPENINIDSLLARIDNKIEEIIIATDATLSGQTTAHYIANILKPYKIKVSRLAFGIPIGGELDYIDEGTLAIALQERNIFI